MSEGFSKRRSSRELSELVFSSVLVDSSSSSRALRIRTRDGVDEGRDRGALLALAPPCAGMAPAPEEFSSTYPRDASATEFVYYCTAHTSRPRTRVLLVAMVTRGLTPSSHGLVSKQHAVYDAFNYGLTDRSFFDDSGDYPAMFMQNFDGTSLSPYTHNWQLHYPHQRLHESPGRAGDSLKTHRQPFRALRNTTRGGPAGGGFVFDGPLGPVNFTALAETGWYGSRPPARASGCPRTRTTDDLPCRRPQVVLRSQRGQRCVSLLHYDSSLSMLHTHRHPIVLTARTRSRRLAPKVIEEAENIAVVKYTFRYLEDPPSLPPSLPHSLTH